MSETPERPSRMPKVALAVGLLMAGAVAGGVLGGTLSASAADGSSPTASYGAPPAGGSPSAGGSAPTRSDEKVVTGSLATKLRTSALAKVPGGTVYRIETDAGDGAYEVHMRRSDGTLVTVKFDKNLAVLGVEDGMGKGDPMLGGGQPPSQ